MVTLTIFSVWWRIKHGYELLEVFQDQSILNIYALDGYTYVLNTYKGKKGVQPVEPSE